MLITAAWNARRGSNTLCGSVMSPVLEWNDSMSRQIGRLFVILALLLGSNLAAETESAKVDLGKLVGQSADVAPSAYFYRADRAPDQNPTEGWILLMQYANQPFDKAVDVNTPAVRSVLCGLLWEEVRPVRWVALP
jgi:hypothetical protein